jgi:DNA-damage-inducible protein J
MDMAKTGYITARVEPKLKASAGRVLSKVGVSTSDAITMFLRQVVLHDGLPFEVRAPNAETTRALREMRNPTKRAKMKTASTTEEMFEDILGKNWKKKSV